MVTTEFQLKQQKKILRLTNKTFQFDPRIKQGFYSAKYFLKTTKIIQENLPNQRILMQFFQKQHAMLCGIDEVIALVHTYADKPEQLKIYALNDGDLIEPYETVLTIEGAYESFGYLEGLIDGILARRTSVATNSHNVVKAVGNLSEIVFMGDRDDCFNQQQGDGYAAYIGGIKAQATDAMLAWIGGEGMGTMPHALIQQFDGNLIAACDAYRNLLPNDNLVALIDYNNNVIEDGLAVAKYFQKDLFAVRVDTAANMIDNYFITQPTEKFNNQNIYGTNTILIKALRQAFDTNGFQDIKIIVSGGFTVDKIKQFVAENTPVDYYGVGSALIKVNIAFTGDCVLLNGKPQAKSGRSYKPNPRLKAVI